MGVKCRDAMVGDRRWAAPSHAATETLRTIRRYELAGLVSTESASAMIAQVASAPVRYVGPTRSMLAGQWELRHNFSAYDAAYVVVAKQFQAPLLTTDGRLGRAATAAGVEVQLVQRA